MNTSIKEVFTMDTKKNSTKSSIWFDYFTRQLQEKNLISEREFQDLKRKIEAQRQKENSRQQH